VRPFVRAVALAGNETGNGFAPAADRQPVWLIAALATEDEGR
ncbi:MAG: hypothetical protein RL290_1097, partial [Actinomycetota bacterium]